MNKYQVTITDNDTYINRVVEVQATSPMHAHKDAMFNEVHDFEVEEITRIVDSHQVTVYTPATGFKQTTT